MKRFIKFLNDNSNSILTDKEGYNLQVYGNGKNGNIIKNGKVLSRFSIGEEMVCFYFSQDSNPHLFDYKGYYLKVENKVDEIKNLNHKDAETLCEVIKRFIADNN